MIALLTSFLEPRNLVTILVGLSAFATILTLAEIVELLNLRQLFEAETARERLRQAGFRSERHLVTYLAFRLITPLLFALVVFIYSSTVFADRIPGSMRLLTTMVGLVAGFYLPNIFLKNLIQRRQASIRRAWSDALDLLLICVESAVGSRQ